MTPGQNIRNMVVSIRAAIFLSYIGTLFFYNKLSSQATVKESAKTDENSVNRQDAETIDFCTRSYAI
jgi:hypothetical protein